MKHKKANWLLIEQGQNPSSDYFIKPQLASDGWTSYDLSLPSAVRSVRNGTNLVFVRYLTPQWRFWVEQHRSELGRIAFFMDDDLFDLQAQAGLPLRYRWKLYRFAWRYQRWLRRMGAELWVSNQWLAEKYDQWKPKIITPQTPYSADSSYKTLFYHGSASHTQEINWLLPVIEEVLSRNERLCFEIIGDQKVRMLFSHLDRVFVVHPMKWSTYKAFLIRPGRSIGLAPLLENNFNHARSATKFYDICSAGAVGIYADHPVYSGTVHHKENGYLLPMEPEAWIEAILQLVGDENYRLQLLEGARTSI